MKKDYYLVGFDESGKEIARVQLIHGQSQAVMLEAKAIIGNCDRKELSWWIETRTYQNIIN